MTSGDHWEPVPDGNLILNFSDPEKDSLWITVRGDCLEVIEAFGDTMEMRLPDDYRLCRQRSLALRSNDVSKANGIRISRTRKNFMSMEVLNLVLGAAVVVIAAYLAWKHGGSVSDRVTGIAAVVENARGWVGAAEQLYSTGKLSRDTRFNWVLQRLREEFPTLDEDTLAAGIEAAVHWYKLLREKAAA